MLKIEHSHSNIINKNNNKKIKNILLWEEFQPYLKSISKKIKKVSFYVKL